ncbi:MAG: flagellar biosynthesis protein FlhB [Hyphomicrobiaceae bacterium]
MAEEADREGKTEEASQRRIDDALAKGNVPFSREASSAAALVVLGLILPLAAATVARDMVPGLVLVLDRLWDLRLQNSQDVLTLFWALGLLIGASLWPAILAVAVISLLASGLQNTPRFVGKRIKPEYARISPSKGFARIFGAAGFVEFLKSLAKILAISIALYLVLTVTVRRMSSPTMLRPDDLVQVVIDESKRLFLAVGLLVTVLAIADLIWSRLKWRKDLRMSLQEIKDESKDAEGSPLVRARRWSIARNRARKRMLAAIPRATLVVANPTHYAIALRYVQGETAAPLVIAKGIDHIAIRIRALAEQNNIPVVEDKALARSLYAAVAADRPIPPEFYRSVAEIILHLMAKK